MGSTIKACSTSDYCSLLLCYRVGLSHHYFILKLLQLPPNWVPEFCPCPFIQSIINTTNKGLILLKCKSAPTTFLFKFSKGSTFHSEQKPRSLQCLSKSLPPLLSIWPLFLPFFALLASPNVLFCCSSHEWETHLGPLQARLIPSRMLLSLNPDD